VFEDAAAVKAAVERLDQGRQDPRSVVLPAKLVVRSTTGNVPSPAPAAADPNHVGSAPPQWLSARPHERPHKHESASQRRPVAV